MPRNRKKNPPVTSKPRTQIGGTSLIGEKILNHQQLNIANYDQITLWSTISIVSLIAFLLTVSGYSNILHLF